MSLTAQKKKHEFGTLDENARAVSTQNPTLEDYYLVSTERVHKRQLVMAMAGPQCR